MQRAKASACWVFVDWESADAVAEPPATVDDGLLVLLLNATAGRARLAVAMMAAVARAVRSHGRRDWRMTRLLSFMMTSSGFDAVPAWTAMVARRQPPWCQRGENAHRELLSTCARCLRALLHPPSQPFLCWT
jgi:hypothetical protein